MKQRKIKRDIGRRWRPIRKLRHLNSSKYFERRD
jgi:hypothetical protein